MSENVIFYNEFIWGGPWKVKRFQRRGGSSLESEFFVLMDEKIVLSCPEAIRHTTSSHGYMIVSWMDTSSQMDT